MTDVTIRPVKDCRLHLLPAPGALESPCGLHMADASLTDRFAKAEDRRNVIDVLTRAGYAVKLCRGCWTEDQKQGRRAIAPPTTTSPTPAVSYHLHRGGAFFSCVRALPDTCLNGNIYSGPEGCHVEFTDGRVTNWFACQVIDIGALAQRPGVHVCPGCYPDFTRKTRVVKGADVRVRINGVDLLPLASGFQCDTHVPRLPHEHDWSDPYLSARSDKGEVIRFCAGCGKPQDDGASLASDACPHTYSKEQVRRLVEDVASAATRPLHDCPGCRCTGR